MIRIDRKVASRTWTLSKARNADYEILCYWEDVYRIWARSTLNWTFTHVS